MGVFQMFLLALTLLLLLKLWESESIQIRFKKKGLKKGAKKPKQLKGREE